MDMDCNFDAPMFVDFQNLAGDHDEQQEAEAYFEVDHETDIKEPPAHEKPVQNEETAITTTNDIQKNNQEEGRTGDMGGPASRGCWVPQIPTSSKPNDSEGREVAAASDNMDALVSRG